MTINIAKVSLVNVKLMFDQCALYLFNMLLDTNIGDNVREYFMFVGSKSSQKFRSMLL